MTHHLTNPRLLEILVDPVNKTPLRYVPDKQELICDTSRRAYPIRDGIPILLISESREMDESEVKK